MKRALGADGAADPDEAEAVRGAAARLVDYADALQDVWPLMTEHILRTGTTRERRALFSLEPLSTGTHAGEALSFGAIVRPMRLLWERIVAAVAAWTDATQPVPNATLKLLDEFATLLRGTDDVSNDISMEDEHFWRALWLQFVRTHVVVHLQREATRAIFRDERDNDARLHSHFLSHDYEPFPRFEPRLEPEGIAASLVDWGVVRPEWSARLWRLWADDGDADRALAFALLSLRLERYWSTFYGEPEVFHVAPVVEGLVWHTRLHLPLPPSQERRYFPFLFPVAKTEYLTMSLMYDVVENKDIGPLAYPLLSFWLMNNNDSARRWPPVYDDFVPRSYKVRVGRGRAFFDGPPWHNDGGTAPFFPSLRYVLEKLAPFRHRLPYDWMTPLAAHLDTRGQ